MPSDSLTNIHSEHELDQVSPYERKRPYQNHGIERSVAHASLRNIHPNVAGPYTDSMTVSPVNNSTEALSAFNDEYVWRSHRSRKKRKWNADQISVLNGVYTSQLSGLNEMYARTTYLTKKERNELAKRLSRTQRSVDNWFGRRRQAEQITLS